MTNKIPAVFPFMLPSFEGKKIWMAYYQKRRDEIAEKHGYYAYTGNPERDRSKTWSWYEVDVTITSETTLEFQVYDMRDFTYGGRGDKKELFKHTCPNANLLADYVEKRKREVAAYVHKQRKNDEMEETIRHEQDEVYKELFGS